MRYLDEIAIHCAATRPEWMQGKPTADKVAEITRWHKARGWSGNGYHYVIDRDGTIMAARPVERTGAHIKGHNRGKIAICLIGGHGSSADDDFSDNFTIAQDKALWSFIGDLKRQHPTITEVTGHNQYAAKACPGFNVPIWLRSHAPKPKNRPFGGLIKFFRNIFG